MRQQPRKATQSLPGRTQADRAPLSTSDGSERAITRRRPVKREARFSGRAEAVLEMLAVCLNCSHPWRYHIIPGDTCYDDCASVRTGCWFQNGWVHAGFDKGGRGCDCSERRPGEPKDLR